VKINVNVKSRPKEEEEEEEEDEEEEQEEQKEEEEEDDENGSANDVDDPEIVGDPTEAAMLVVSRKAKIKEREPFSNYKVIDEVPFKSEQKFRASLVDTEDGPEIF